MHSHSKKCGFVDFWSKMWRGWGGMPQFGENVRPSFVEYCNIFCARSRIPGSATVEPARAASILGSTSAHGVVGRVFYLMRGAYILDLKNQILPCSARVAKAT